MSSARRQYLIRMAYHHRLDSSRHFVDRVSENVGSICWIQITPNIGLGITRGGNTDHRKWNFDETTRGLAGHPKIRYGGSERGEGRPGPISRKCIPQV